MICKLSVSFVLPDSPRKQGQLCQFSHLVSQLMPELTQDDGRPTSEWSNQDKRRDAIALAQETVIKLRQNALPAPHNLGIVQQLQTKSGSKTRVGPQTDLRDCD